MLRLTHALRDEIVRHLVAEWPNEGCGMLAGRDGTVEAVFPLRNIEIWDDLGYALYQAHPEDVLAAFQEIDDRGLEFLGTFHSHPGGGAYPSGIDVRKAMPAYPDAHYLIVGLKEHWGKGWERPGITDAEIRAFTIVDASVAEQDVLVDGVMLPKKRWWWDRPIPLIDKPSRARRRRRSTGGGRRLDTGGA